MKDCANCGNRCMDMDMDPYCSAVNKPHGLNLARGKPVECGVDSLLWKQDLRHCSSPVPSDSGERGGGNDNLSAEKHRLIAEALGDIDTKVRARIKAPFRYETILEKNVHGPMKRYRIADANDDALCNTYDKVYADFIVEALNAYRK